MNFKGLNIKCFFICLIITFSTSTHFAQNWEQGKCSDTLQDILPNYNRVECNTLSLLSLRADLGYNHIMMNSFRSNLMKNDPTVVLGCSIGIDDFILGARIKPYSQYLDETTSIKDKFYDSQHKLQIVFGELFLGYSFNLPLNISVEPQIAYSLGIPTIWFDGENLEDTGLPSVKTVAMGIVINKYIPIFKPHTYMAVFVAGNANFHNFTSINPSFGKFHLDFSIGISLKSRTLYNRVHIFPK